jgi:hypothetical protein
MRETTGRFTKKNPKECTGRNKISNIFKLHCQKFQQRSDKYVQYVYKNW